MGLFLGLAEVGLIYLNRLAKAAEWTKVAFAHGLADAVSNKPRGFQGASKVR
jgi:hypothetical protein